MSRTVPAGILTALGQAEVQPFYAVEFDFDTAPIRLWTGHGSRTVEGETYTGAGDLLTISGLEEVSDLSAKSITVTLSGADTNLISAALQEPYQYRKCRVYFGVISVSDVVEVFSGITNKMTIEDGPDASAISVTIDSKLVQLEKASNRRYTSESHKARDSNSGDTFFDFLADIQDKEIIWGRKND